MPLEKLQIRPRGIKRKKFFSGLVKKKRIVVSFKKTYVTEMGPSKRGYETYYPYKDNSQKCFPLSRMQRDLHWMTYRRIP